MNALEREAYLAQSVRTFEQTNKERGLPLMNKWISNASVLALLCAAQPTLAQTAPAANETDTLSEVIVTGTRLSGVRAADSAAPVQVVDQSALLKTGAVDLTAALSSSVPSLNINTTGYDAAALNVQAALRGLSPNDTLVLIDGKRIHGTANLAVDSGSPYSGSATVDLSWIPVAAIDHVEVLTDGAAAQYGTDAIAGVVNIILKKGVDAGSLSATGGQYFNSEGATGSWSLNHGFNLNDRGFLNVTLEEKRQNYTYEGIGDERYQSANGKQLATCTGGQSEFSAFPFPCLQLPDTSVGNAANFPYENRAIGAPTYTQYNGMFNAGYDVTPNLQLYGFGSFGYRQSEHYENYRPPSNTEGVTSTGQTVIPFVDGFDPSEQIKEHNDTITAGFKGAIDTLNFDFSSTYGHDYVPIYVINSANNGQFAALQSESATPLTPQTNFNDGAFETTQWTNTLDLSKDFAVGLASPLNIAGGAEFRHETFAISAGEPASYVDGGVQSYAGFLPLDAGGHHREVAAGYIDAAVNPIAALHVDVAGRYEHYSDFGDALVGKFTARYDFNPMFAVRGTVSNGFRAPTLAEEYYSSTQVSPTAAVAQLPPNSAAALDAGFKPLEPEKSTNYSVGFVAHPMDRMQITLDAYDIQLNDRIEPTNAFYGEFSGTIIDNNIMNTVAARGVAIQSGLQSVGISTFTNAANTNTVGLDLTSNYASDFGAFGDVDWSIGFNYNHTRFTSISALPAAAACAGATCAALGQTPGASLITPEGQSDLVNATPQEKVILQGLWTLGQWRVNLRETIYGPTHELNVAPGLNAGSGGQFVEQINTTGITDLDIGYKVTRYLQFDVGANNLFNKFPPTAPVLGGQPADGLLVFHVPYTFAPWGINGGYYYGRVTLNW